MPKKGYKQTEKHIANRIKNQFGSVRSKETKKLMSRIQKNLWEDKEYRRKHVNGMIGIRWNIGRKEKMRKAMVGKWAGEKNPKYIDGRTPLVMLIRGLEEYTNWRKEVFKRDNYICQKCKSKGNLEAHHCIKSFSVIFSEFLKEYDQFSPIEDKETLIRLATKYKSFWDLSNGKTLCKDCHRN